MSSLVATFAIFEGLYQRRTNAPAAIITHECRTIRNSFTPPLFGPSLEDTLI